MADDAPAFAGLPAGDEKTARLRLAQYATARNDITIPQFTTVLAPLDEILVRRGGIPALRLYDELERDAHTHAVLQKRRHQVVAREWIVKPGGEAAADVALAELIEAMLRGIDYDQVTLDMLDATLKGYSVGEAIYVRDGRHWTVERIEALEARRFVFDEHWEPRLVTMTNMEGEKLPKRKFIVHRHGAKGNNPYGLGLGAKLFWPVHFKRQGIAFWARFLERFASPIPVGKHLPGAAPSEIVALQQVLEAMNGASSITIPLGTELDTFEAKSNVSTGPTNYVEWSRFWNGEISKAVLGETLTTEMGPNGARAASETHSDILDLLVDADADLQCGTINRTLIPWLAAANYPSAALPQVWRPRMSNESAEEDVAIKRAERRAADFAALGAARAAGYEPEELDEYAAEIMGVPVRAVPRAEAQKKTPLIRLSRSPRGSTWAG